MQWQVIGGLPTACLMIFSVCIKASCAPRLEEDKLFIINGRADIRPKLRTGEVKLRKYERRQRDREQYQCGCG